MKIIEAGHIYELDVLDERRDNQLSPERHQLCFVNREAGNEHPGYQTQEVIRALIDRTQHCHNCLPADENYKIVYHLRMALVYHEMRTLRRKAEKGFHVESIATDPSDGHLVLQTNTGCEGMDPLTAKRRATPTGVL